MTKDEARKEAHRRWGNSVLLDGGCYGVVCLHQKPHPARYEVGYMVRVFHVPSPMVVMGRSSLSWDAAFANV